MRAAQDFWYFIEKALIGAVWHAMCLYPVHLSGPGRRGVSLLALDCVQGIRKGLPKE
jgi:hypothetical protein